MSGVPFTKMVGAGNDFVVIDNRARRLPKNLGKLAQTLCSRKVSIGADGLILLEKSNHADGRMRIFNPDGSEAEMCGNGVRCLAKFAVQKKLAKNKLVLETLAGDVGAEVRGDEVKAKLMDPSHLRLNFEVPLNGAKEKLNFINTGVPHVIKVVGSLDRVDIQHLGPAIRFHEHFAPKGANVDFIAKKPGNQIDIRTYERGVENETLACGTGSAAGALVAAALYGLKSPVRVCTQSGEILKVSFRRKGSAFCDVYLEGPIQMSFEGSVNL